MTIEISQEDSDYLYDVIQKVIDGARCRMPCSPQEANGAEIIKKEMEETCDEVTIEPFKCHPRAFLGWIRIDIFLVATAMLLFLFVIPLNSTPGGKFEYDWLLIMALIIFGLSAIAFLIVNREFFNYKEFIDPLFKKKESQNVVGKIKAEGEIKNIIMFAGHHDSALQFNLLRYLKYGYPIVIFLGLGIMFLWMFISLAFLVLALLNFANYVWFQGIVIWLLIIGLLPLIFLFFFVSSGEKANKVPGAVDNLSAVSITLGVGRYLKNHKEIIPKNTEIRLISFGCEEAGLRGAYRYSAAHKEELLKYNAELVNMDGIQSIKKVEIVEFEPTTKTKHSEEVVQKLMDAAKLVNVQAKRFGASALEKFVGQISGGTDAAAFSKAGIKAANISAMEIKKFVKFYHQPTDTIKFIDRGSLDNVLKICIGYLVNASKA